MSRFRYVISETSSEEDYPLQAFDLVVEMDVETADVPVPEAAQRKLAWQALQRIVADLEPQDLEQIGHTEAGHVVRPPRPATPSDSEWVQPAGIDMRIVKSAHRVIQEVSRRGETGRAVLASELVQDGLVSAPTMSRLLRDDEQAGQYIEPYILVGNVGRTKSLDLTPKGRLLASKIRAGVVPS